MSGWFPGPTGPRISTSPLRTRRDLRQSAGVDPDLDAVGLTAEDIEQVTPDIVEQILPAEHLDGKGDGPDGHGAGRSGAGARGPAAAMTSGLP